MDAFAPELGGGNPATEAPPSRQVPDQRYIDLPEGGDSRPLRVAIVHMTPQELDQLLKKARERAAAAQADA